MADFDSAGRKAVIIMEAFLAEARFAENDPQAVDVALRLQTPDGRYETWWTGELSQRYGIGHASDKQQWELTLSQLENAGWKHGQNINNDTLQSLVKVQTEVLIKENEKNGVKRYFASYLGPSTFVPKKLEPAEQKAKLAALFGANPGQPAPFAQSTSNDLPF